MSGPAGTAAARPAAAEDARSAAAAWLERYLRAWETNDPADIAGLFTADAHYLPSPWAMPWSGRDAIVREWLAHRDEPGTWRFEGRVLGVDGDLATIAGNTTYLAGPNTPKARFANLWLVRMAECGTAESFEEWWIAAP